MSTLSGTRDYRRGFTFVEILLVVGLLGVVAAMSLPNLSQSFGQVQLRTAAGDVAYLLRYAQSRAIVTTHQFRMVFALDPLSYWLEEAGAGGDGVADGEETYGRIKGRFGRTFLVPQGISLQADPSEIVLTPDGAITPVTVRVCQKQKCLLVTTRLQKGQVHVIEEGSEVAP